MKKTVLVLAALITGACLTAPASAENEGILSDTGIKVSADASIFSEYVWRGMLLDGDAVLQPGIYVAGPSTRLGTLTAKFWSSHDLQNQDSRHSEEYDYILDYTYTLKDINFSLGHTYYDFPETDTFSREFYAGVAFPKTLLSPSFFVYRDYGSPEDGGAEGTYIVLNAAYSIPVTIKDYACSLDFSGHYGYNHELFINGNGGDLGLGLGLSIPLTKTAILVPGINYSVAFKDLKKESDGNQKERLFTGVTFKLGI